MINIVNKFNIEEIKENLREYVRENILSGGYDEETKEKYEKGNKLINRVCYIMGSLMLPLMIILLYFTSDSGILMSVCVSYFLFIALVIFILISYLEYKSSKDTKEYIFNELDNIGNEIKDYKILVNLIEIATINRYNNYNNKEKSKKIDTFTLKVINNKLKDYIKIVNNKEVKSISYDFNKIIFKCELDNGDIEEYIICANKCIENTKVSEKTLEFYNYKIILKEPYIKS